MRPVEQIEWARKQIGQRQGNAPLIDALEKTLSAQRFIFVRNFRPSCVVQHWRHIGGVLIPSTPTTITPSVAHARPLKSRRATC
jgi:hypothetical protein